jgi:hypothetical protein
MTATTKTIRILAGFAAALALGACGTTEAQVLDDVLEVSPVAGHEDPDGAGDSDQQPGGPPWILLPDADRPEAVPEQRLGCVTVNQVLPC